MANPRRRRSLLALLVVVSLLLLTLDFREGQEGPLTTLQRGVMAVVAPVQDALAGVVRPIGGFFGSLGQLGSLREEIARLEEENQALRDGTVSVAQLRQENDELRDLLRIQRRLGYTSTGAQVIARAPGAFDWSVIIDRGADQGIAAGMVVVNGDGLVGRVTDVTGGHARVQLLISPNARYVVRMVDGRGDGLLTGRGSRPLEVQILDPEEEVEAGSQVVTRAFEATTIPDGIPIGIVEEVPDSPRGLERVLAVRPHVDFSRLNFVQVILDVPAAPATLNPDELVDPPDRPRPQMPGTPGATPGTATEPAVEPTATPTG
jgi:rod shape-determining protein MreC